MKSTIAALSIAAVLASAGSAFGQSLPAGVYHCRAGEECVYGPIHQTFPTYGNVAPTNLGDCTFAAAANWEQVELGAAPDPSLIGYEFAAAGGGGHGLTADQFFSYWEEQGIGGDRLIGWESFTLDREDVENAVWDYGALLVELRFGYGYFGTYRVRPGLHEVLLDGYTPEGPLVVSWGRVVQMTWHQWVIEAREMLAISVA